jgi:hypothetical protein
MRVASSDSLSLKLSGAWDLLVSGGRAIAFYGGQHFDTMGL